MESYKPIKFFLRVKDKVFPNIESLQKDFNIDEVYKLYQKGVMQRWFLVHELHVQAKALDEFENKYGKENLNESNIYNFCKIFFNDIQQSDLEYIIQNYKLNEKWKAENKNFIQNKEEQTKIINSYHKEYERLKLLIAKDSNNMPAIRLHLDDLSKNYIELFKLDYQACVNFFINSAPIALLLMFANPAIRHFFDSIPEARNKILEYINENIPTAPNKLDGKSLANFVFPQNIELKDVVSIIKTTNKLTDSSWEDIEWDKNKKFMILFKGYSSTVRPYKDQNNEMPKYIRTLPIINGIEYRNDSRDNYLIYMEV